MLENEMKEKLGSRDAGIAKAMKAKKDLNVWVLVCVNSFTYLYLFNNSTLKSSFVPFLRIYITALLD